MSGDRLALVCNGIIENHEALRAAQKAAGFVLHLRHRYRGGGQRNISRPACRRIGSAVCGAGNGQACWKAPTPSAWYPPMNRIAWWARAGDLPWWWDYPRVRATSPRTCLRIDLRDPGFHCARGRRYRRHPGWKSPGAGPRRQYPSSGRFAPATCHPMRSSSAISATTC